MQAVYLTVLLFAYKHHVYKLWWGFSKWILAIFFTSTDLSMVASP